MRGPAPAPGSGKLPPPEAEELKELRTRIAGEYDVRRAAMFLKLLRYSYSSGCKSYASQPFDLRRLFSLIRELEDRMANVVIENQDFETLIKHYDRPDGFFYADPPYFASEGMYDTEFDWNDHIRLRDTLADIKGKFLLSYNDCAEIRKLYDGFSVFDMMGAGKPDEDYGVRDFKARFGGKLVEEGRFVHIAHPLLYKIGKWGVKLLKKI